MLKNSRRVKHIDKKRITELVELVHNSTIDPGVPQEWLSFAPNAAKCRQKLGALGWEYREGDKFGDVIFVADALSELGLTMGVWDDKADD